jgi:hypothetical protein
VLLVATSCTRFPHATLGVDIHNDLTNWATGALAQPLNVAHIVLRKAPRLRLPSSVRLQPVRNGNTVNTRSHSVSRQIHDIGSHSFGTVSSIGAHTLRPEHPLAFLTSNKVSAIVFLPLVGTHRLDKLG